MNMDMNANWDDLRVFLTLAREGTLTTAAKALGVSHPTVARRVQALEKQIGARLFERNSRGVALTAAGQAFVPAARALIERAGKAETRDDLVVTLKVMDRILRARHDWIPNWHAANHRAAFWRTLAVD